MHILIPVGIGELYDKISILEIKAERISDPEKLAYVHTELAELRKIAAGNQIDEELYKELKKVNEEIWDSVGKQWDKEASGDLDAEIIELARTVYTLNDKRAEAKKKINLAHGSSIVEVKSYNKKQ
jgi:hypothetical protein